MVVAVVVMAVTTTIAVVAVVMAAVGEQAAELPAASLFSLARQSFHRAIPFCSLTLAMVWTKP